MLLNMLKKKCKSLEIIFCVQGLTEEKALVISPMS